MFLFNFVQLEGLTCYDGEDLPDLYVKVEIHSENAHRENAFLEYIFVFQYQYIFEHFEFTF